MNDPEATDVAIDSVLRATQATWSRSHDALAAADATLADGDRWLAEVDRILEEPAPAPGSVVDLRGSSRPER